MEFITQKCDKTLTLNERSIRWSGVSNNARPETTPALFISIVICGTKKKVKRKMINIQKLEFHLK